MKHFEFIPIAPNPEWGIFEQEVLPEVDVYVGKYPVIYGYRLRAGELENDWNAELDICCGDSAPVFKALKDRVKEMIIENVKASQWPFKGIPRFSKIKPYPLDLEFCRIMQLQPSPEAREPR